MPLPSAPAVAFVPPPPIPPPLLLDPDPPVPGLLAFLTTSTVVVEDPGEVVEDEFPVAPADE